MNLHEEYLKYRTRRQFFKDCSVGVGTLGLASLLNERLFAAAGSLRYFSRLSRYSASRISTSFSVGARATHSRNPCVTRSFSPRFSSVIIRRASAPDASTNTLSLSVASACSGVLVRGRRSAQTSRLGASNAMNAAYGAVRRQNVYRPRRCWSPFRLITHLSPL